jgi:hypothetical protein
MARFKRLADHVQYTGPVSIGGDCTKVRQCLTYSNDFGSHVLGSVLPMDQCEVHEAEDIDTAINRIKSQNAMATQVRAIMVKVNGDKTIFFTLTRSLISDASTWSQIPPRCGGAHSKQRERDRGADT